MMSDVDLNGEKSSSTPLTAPIFVLQCIECNTIVADSSNLTADESRGESEIFRVRRICNVRVSMATNENRKNIACNQCGRTVGHSDDGSEWSFIEKNRVKQIVFSSNQRNSSGKRVPAESLEGVVRARQRQLKVALVELSKKAAAVNDRIATLDAQAAILRRKRDEQDSDDDDDDD